MLGCTPNEIDNETVLSVQPNANLMPIEGERDVFRLATPGQVRSNKRNGIQLVGSQDSSAGS